MPAIKNPLLLLALLPLLTACPRATNTPVGATDASIGQPQLKATPTAPPDSPPAEPVRDAGAPSDVEACVNAWLEKKDMDPYGHPEGTMYTGGTPLFDERTGEQRDRLQYIFNRHPEAREACGGKVTDAGAGGPAVK